MKILCLTKYIWFLSCNLKIKLLTLHSTIICIIIEINFCLLFVCKFNCIIYNGLI